MILYVRDFDRRNIFLRLTIGYTNVSNTTLHTLIDI